jgi:hypothetical protein
MARRKRQKWQTSDEVTTYGMTQRRVRETLEDTRNRLNLTIGDVAERITKLGPSLSTEGFRKWVSEHEGLPAIEAVRYWARALGYEFVIDLVPADDQYLSVPVRNDLIELVRAMNRTVGPKDAELLSRIVPSASSSTRRSSAQVRTSPRSLPTRRSSRAPRRSSGPPVLGAPEWWASDAMSRAE